MLNQCLTCSVRYLSYLCLTCLTHTLPVSPVHDLSQCTLPVSPVSYCLSCTFTGQSQQCAQIFGMHTEFSQNFRIYFDCQRMYNEFSFRRHSSSFRHSCDCLISNSFSTKISVTVKQKFHESKFVIRNPVYIRELLSFCE